MTETGVDRLKARVLKAFNSSERHNVEQHWENIAEYVVPGLAPKYNFEGITPGRKVTQKIFDSTAYRANRDLAAAINATLTNAATKWSELRYIANDLNDDDESIEWLEESNNAMHSAFNESNFNNEIGRAYRILTSMGNMAVMLEEDDKLEDGSFGGFRFTALHLGEIAWTENAKGIVDEAFRRIHLTARQALEKFGEEAFDKEFIEDAELNPHKEHVFYHVIMPRKPEEIQYDDFGLADPKNRPFTSTYIHDKSNTIVFEGGYYEFPLFAVRWDLEPSEVYGRGPGHMALPDIKTLNKLQELDLRVRAKNADPPIVTEANNMVTNFDIRPGGISGMRNIDRFKELVPQARFDVTNDAVQRLQQSIKETFFLDKLMLPPRTEHGEMTALEVRQRVEQMNRVLSPTLGRLDQEFLKPLVVRAFKIMLRAGAFPEAPPRIADEGLNIQIEFVNQLARSQKSQDVTAILEWLNILGQAAQFNPEIIDKADFDLIAETAGRVIGVPEKIIVSQEKVAQIREARAQQQQRQQEMEQQVQAADIQSKIGQ